MHNVALQILDVIILISVIDKRVGTAIFIINKVNITAIPSLANEYTVNIVIIVNGITNSFLRSQSVRAILVRNRSASFRCGSKLSTVPSERVGRAVVVEILSGKHRLKDNACQNYFMSSIFRKLP